MDTLLWLQFNFSVGQSMQCLTLVLVMFPLAWPLALFIIAAHLLICSFLSLSLQSLSYFLLSPICLLFLASCSVYHSCSSASLFISLSLTLSLLFCAVFVFLLSPIYLLVVIFAQLLPFSALAIDLSSTALFFCSCELLSLFRCFHSLL